MIQGIKTASIQTVKVIRHMVFRLRRWLCSIVCFFIGHQYDNYFYSQYRLENCHCCGKDIADRKRSDLRTPENFDHRVYQMESGAWCYEIYYDKRLAHYETGFESRYEAVLMLDCELSKQYGGPDGDQ